MNAEDLNQFRADINQVDGLVNQCIELIEDTGAEYDDDYEAMHDLFLRVQGAITNFQERKGWI